MLIIYKGVFLVKQTYVSETSGEPAVSQAGDVDGSSVRDVDGAVGLATAVADRVAARKPLGSAVGAGGGVLRQGQ